MKYDYQQTPLWDSNLSHEERLDYLLEELTLEEKLQCLGTGTPAVERLGMTGFYVGGEAAHGVQARHDQSFDKGEAVFTTIFPNPIGMSATWDQELIRQVGDVVGKEARVTFQKEKHKGGLCLWAPTVDMERDPRWGRTEEGYGEDPYLTGKMASSFIQGLKGDEKDGIRCGATLKHFYGNNVEDGRVWKSSSIDPRNKYEYYLEPFRRCVEEGGAESLMTSYNEINGVPAILNKEVSELAKEKWGLHHVVCDGGDMTQTVDAHGYFGSHTETVAAGLKAGVDCFTDDLDIVMEGAKEALELGMIQESDIDRALRCHFETLLRLGLFDISRQRDSVKETELNAPQSQQISREMSAESVVLLKNQETDGKRILPLSLESPPTLAVIGALADEWFLDWYSGLPPYRITPYQGICRALEEREISAEDKVLCESGLLQIRLSIGDRYLGLLEDGVTLGLVPESDAEVFEVALWDAEQMTLRAMSNGLLLSTKDGRDDEDVYRAGVVQASEKEAFGWFVKEVFYFEKEPEDSRNSLETMLKEGRGIALRSWNDSTLFVDEKDRIRVGEPQGFVEEGVPEKVVRYTGNDGVCRDIAGDWIQQGLSGVVETAGGYRYRTLGTLYPEVVYDGIQAAQEAAAKADTVIFVGGAHPMITCKEEKDRKDINFPPSQRSLIQQVFRANPHTVLALVSSVPFAITWEDDHLPAILTMAGGGMELGNGLADVLFGKRAPAGRLNMTWYRDTEQLPDMDDYDIIQGERTYQYFQGDVLYPFGYGLTYGETTLGQMHVQQMGAEITVSCVISRPPASPDIDDLQDEVVQLYFTKKASDVKRPIRQLVGFRRIKALAPGETREIEFHIPLEDLQYYDTIQRKMLLEPGEYEFQIAKSSQDICECATLVLEGTPRGQRDGTKWQPADHYDRSANMYLWEGHMGYQSVVHQGSDLAAQDLFESFGDLWQNVNEVIKDETYGVQEDSLLLEYDHVLFPGKDAVLVLDMDWEGEVSVEVYFAGKHAGEAFLSPIPAQQKRHDARFRQIRIELTGALRLLSDGEAKGSPQTGTLRFKAKGNLRICRWRFEV